MSISVVIVRKDQGGHQRFIPAELNRHASAIHEHLADVQPNGVQTRWLRERKVNQFTGGVATECPVLNHFDASWQHDRPQSAIAHETSGVG